MNSSHTSAETRTGSTMLILLGMLLVAFLLFITADQSQDRVDTIANARTPAVSLENNPVAEPRSEPATNSLPQVVHGQQVAYTLRLPADWVTQSVLVDGVDNRSASFSNLNVAVIVQRSKISTTAEAAWTAVAALRSSATDFFSSRPVPLQLDGREWSQFVVKCRINQTSMGYQYYVYSGHEGTYQIVAWTELLHFERELRLLRTILQSFRFPPNDGDRTGDAQPSTPPATVSTRAAVP